MNNTSYAFYDIIIKKRVMIEERKCYSYIISKSFADCYNKINILISKMIDKEVSNSLIFNDKEKILKREKFKQSKL